MSAFILIPMVMIGTPAGSIRIDLEGQPGPVLERIAEVIRDRISHRCDVRIGRSGSADFTLILAVDPALPREGFEIADGPDGSVRITGQNDRSIMYGAGKFLRTSQYPEDGFVPSVWRGKSAPLGSLRAIYAATHFMNFYEAAPADEVGRYLEDLALWGANAVIVHFPTWDFSGFDDPGARRNIEQTRRLLRSAKAVGMRTGLIQCPNQGFTSAPESIRAVPNPDISKRHGNTGVNCCPSTSEGQAYLAELYARLFAEYKDIGLDYLISWPYDEGGCGCGTCAPWGGNAFPKLTQDIAALGREQFPDLEVILSTWLYDLPPTGEWEGLARFVEQDSAWLDGIMCDDHFDFPRYPLEHGTPAGLPLYNFPEISMWGRSPWGAFGANPLPARYESLWKQTEGKLSGGMPYSEGIFEDMNKVVCFQFYWDRNTRAEDTLEEYVAYEFTPNAQPVLEAVRLLEATWIERGPNSVEAFRILQDVDATLPEHARKSWRWRLLYLRGLIDSELFRTKGKFEGEVLRDAFSELTRIYHAENAHSPVKPPTIP